MTWHWEFRQGSILGPLLRNIFYDELMELEMAENANIVGFADVIEKS